MPGLLRCITTDVVAVFNATWAHPGVPVLWRANDVDPLPDPSDTPNFFRNSIHFSVETILAFGGGQGANQKVKFGEVEFIAFASRSLGDEDTLLDLLSDAVATLRSKRVVGSYAGGSDLSFIGPSSGFAVGPSEDGNWFIRGEAVTFEYRFIG